MNDFATRLKKIALQPTVLQQFGRGVERETLRYQAPGALAKTPHPKGLGSAFTNHWITTDFAEQLLEFITPVSHDIETLMAQLDDIHHFTQSQLGEEGMWPLSMPCYVEHDTDIMLAQYGSSNPAKMKTLYREGLKRRYGSLMQVISGVHFNFSFSDDFWTALFGEQSDSERQASQSEAYFALIRNYYRFGWLIPFFFGASPALCRSFLADRETALPFELLNNTLFLPNATSLRLSDLGYTSSAQSTLKIGFNSLEQYLEGLHDAIRRPSDQFAQIGVKVQGEYRQLNSNILQIENELYAPIRPKRVAKSGEKPSEALERGGVEYIEVRSLDVNPFSPVGITADQVRFLDLFLTWAVLSDSDPMDNCELECWRSNWSKVVVSGREVGLNLTIGCQGEQLSLQTWAHRVFDELELIAIEMDKAHGSDTYQDVCKTLRQWIDSPELTLSGQLMEQIRAHGGVGKTGFALGEHYRQANLARPYQFYTKAQMEEEVARSIDAQQAIEAQSDVSFDDYLANYFDYLNA
ncbi:glutamate--cysteine ligase [Vibrio sp. SM6]|uniref:Glutamate--cysteine ligase n=1 Tax=Vibrio agarilyticus TaxID=2726741 RepID=A0A7X8TQH4_9VIBR|nr:glutamate--cysteine ligase [Vibrio agarilyticus]